MAECVAEQWLSLAGHDRKMQRLGRLHRVHTQVLAAGDQGQEGRLARNFAQGLEYGPDASPQRMLSLCVRAQEAAELPGQSVGRALPVLRDVPELFQGREQVV